jgi:adenine-specific DNA-methyltransferase
LYKKHHGSYRECGRIRRVIAKMKNESNGKSSSQRETPEDLGFKVFKLARSNFNAWQDYDGENIQELETLFDQTETPLVKGWKEDDLLTEIMLQQGFPLESKITPQAAFKQNKVQLIESEACAHRLFVCLDPKIKEDTIKHLELRAEDIFVCLDSALTDQAKMRLADVCRLGII